MLRFFGKEYGWNKKKHKKGSASKQALSAIYIVQEGSISPSPSNSSDPIQITAQVIYGGTFTFFFDPPFFVTASGKDQADSRYIRKGFSLKGGTVVHDGCLFPSDQ